MKDSACSSNFNVVSWVCLAVFNAVLMILFAALIATDSVNYIAQWMLEAIPAFQAI